MTVSLVSGPGRVVQFIWGTRGQNTLTFSYPAAIDQPRFWRAPRVGSEMTLFNNQRDSWTLARDYMASFSVRWMSETFWAGTGGFQAFLDWCSAGNTFSVVFDAANAPLYAVPGCLLLDPFAKLQPGLEISGMQSLAIVMRNPTYDLGLAWRGLMFDYAPGGSLTDPFVFSQQRGLAGYRIGSDGVLHLATTNGLRDSHYPFGFANGAFISPKTTLVERGNTNSCLQSEHLNTAPWSNNNVTVTEGFSTAPNGAATSCKLLPNTTNSTHYVTQNITITDQEWLADSIFLRGGNGYNRVRLGLFDAGTTTGALCDINLSTGTIVQNIAIGSVGASLLNANLIPLANGWFRVELQGRLDNVAPAITSGNIFIYLMDNTGATSFAGDGVSFIEAWGGQFQRFGTSIQGNTSSYIPTTTVTVTEPNDADWITWPWQSMPMWLYVDGIDLGWSRLAEFGTLSQWANVQGDFPRLQLFTGSGVGGQTPNHRFNYRNGIPGVTGANQSAAAVTPGANPYDRVQLFCRFFSDASTEIQRSINGGAVAINTLNGASPDFVDFASMVNGGAIIFSLTVSAQIGITRIKVGAAPTFVTTLAGGAAA